MRSEFAGGSAQQSGMGLPNPVVGAGHDELKETPETELVELPGKYLTREGCVADNAQTQLLCAETGQELLDARSGTETGCRSPKFLLHLVEGAIERHAVRLIDEPVDREGGLLHPRGLTPISEVRVQFRDKIADVSNAEPARIVGEGKNATGAGLDVEHLLVQESIADVEQDALGTCYHSCLVLSPSNVSAILLRVQDADRKRSARA